ncbi:MAG: hypothetical protein COA50_12255 [Flavobacteriaceae bacterium]|nr:MAG: hypothetical protein COA50_12255 [Flavobacteriaceae bacterium]
MNIKHIFTIIILATFFIQCQGEKDSPFLITKDHIGKLERTSLLSELETIYKADSIVKDTASRINYVLKKVNIYEKGGLHLLGLTPNIDSIPTIENIHVYDPRFITENGVGLNSTFKDIKDNYTILKIITSLNNVVVLIKDNPVYFTIDKKELPANLRFGTASIEAVQIPDLAKIKYMMVSWD